VTSTRGGRLPNFLYIGPDKAGSSWLHEVLLRHPQIFLSEAKDLYFFDRYYDRGLDWYRAQFARATDDHEVVGEVCQDYLFHPEAAQRIKRDLGNVRLMVTLREPAARAYSSYLYMLKHGEEPGTFREALTRRPELLDHGRYGAALSRYLELFPRSDLHVALFDDLRRDPQAFIDDVLAFLELKPMALSAEELGERLPAMEARSVAMARLVRKVAVWAREHDRADLVGRVKRSRTTQNLLYRPLDRSESKPDPSDVALFWDLLSDDLDKVVELTGVDVRRVWAGADGAGQGR
jgi:hypothetical protein